MSKETKITYTENDKAIVKALTENAEGLTLAGLCDATGIELKAGHVVSAMHKGLIAATGEAEVIKEGKRKVTVYNFVTADVLNKEDGKPFNYTDGEKEVLAAAVNCENPFTLADLATAMGVERLTSGRINGLVKKGNITKNEDKVEVPCEVKSTVKVYTLIDGAADKING